MIDYDLHVQDIITVPLVIWVIGVIVWFLAAAGRRNGKAALWKWILAYGILLFSAYASWTGMGGDPARNLGMGNYILDSPGVRGEYSTTKLVFFLFAAFIGPLLTIAALLYADKREIQRMRDIVS